MGRALFEVSGERRVWRPNQFDTMANFSRCERSEASDVGHKYPHRPITRKRVPLGWGCSSDNMLPTSLSSQAVRDVFGGSAMQVKGDMPRDTRPPFDIPAISYSTPLQKRHREPLAKRISWRSSIVVQKCRTRVATDRCNWRRPSGPRMM